MLLSCKHESAGQVKSWELPCYHKLCTKCLPPALVFGSSATLRQCPIERCDVLFRPLEVREWIDELGVSVEVAGASSEPAEQDPLEATVGQETVVPNQHTSAPAQRGRGGSKRSRSNSIVPAATASNQVSLQPAPPAGPASGQAFPRPSSHVFPLASPFPSRSRTAPSQPSPLRQSFPPVEPAFPPPSHSSSPSSKPSVFTQSQVSATSSSQDSQLSTDSDRELHAAMTVRLENAIKFGDDADAEGETDEEADAHGETDDQEEEEPSETDITQTQARLDESSTSGGSTPHRVPASQGVPSSCAPVHTNHAGTSPHRAPKTRRAAPLRPTNRQSDRPTIGCLSIRSSKGKGKGKRARSDAGQGRVSKKRNRREVPSSSQEKDNEYEELYGHLEYAAQRGDSEDEEEVQLPSSSPERSRYY
ncbi:unnamed protein product [Rhizoctonia solani]|uniref:RING-type domain-containing protein n=1 Tax=Rhizoctonia solani TaxID=456999 RepID=A0A8H3GUT9_9AGAM|nr:unnamed protein product [Rhizoctonia solani]